MQNAFAMSLPRPIPALRARLALLTVAASLFSAACATAPVSTSATGSATVVVPAPVPAPVSTPATVVAPAPTPLAPPAPGPTFEQGIVSWYDEPQMTAAGQWFDPEAMTAAHKTLPLGTIVRVTRLDTLQSVVVTINDRGPYVRGRVIDVARRPARQLDLLRKGLAPCRIEVLRLPSAS